MARGVGVGVVGGGDERVKVAVGQGIGLGKDARGFDSDPSGSEGSRKMVIRMALASGYLLRLMRKK